MKSSEALQTKLLATFRLYFQEHPFIHLESLEATRTTLGEFYGVSDFFPYIQAIACAPYIERQLQSCSTISDSVGLTSVVGTFLSWDEFGGHYTVCQGGQAALPNIINRSQFHSSMFKADMQQVFGNNYHPEFTSLTTDYLMNLKAGLGSEDASERVAHMVAFEMHAESMLTALYMTLKRLTDIPDKGLAFFEAHIGGDDPAEAYHVEMTNRLIDAVIPSEKSAAFLKHFDTACQLHHKWCLSVMGV
ncbi:hypothetical protein [Vibrio sp. 10N.247.310.17]|uniref:hypothetical protein n=1 Tax=Vibrio sp. 10N.247.310.17 TaxID=3229979 RepID=UPI00354D207F